MDKWDVFYDECKADGFWHCFLFVPKNRLRDLGCLLRRARKDSSFNDVMHYKNIRRRTPISSRNSRHVELLLSILCYVLQQQKVQAPLRLPGNSYGIENREFGAKLAIFRYRGEWSIKGDQQETRQNIERTFRMGLKSGLHYLFKEGSPTIDNIFVDFDQKSYNASFDDSNLWNRLKEDLNDNISFTSNSNIVPFGKKQYSQDCDISEIMQLVDVTIGSFRTVVIQDFGFTARYKVTEILRPMIQRNCGHPAWKKNSRYYRGFTLSDAWQENGIWRFKNTEITIDRLQQDVFMDVQRVNV
jgi:hypothetical protein